MRFIYKFISLYRYIIIGSTVISILAVKGILEYLFSTTDEEPKKKDRSGKQKSQDEPIVLRDFTIAQLQDFNGLSKDNGNKVYIGLKRDVFDVTSARDTFYGPGQSYFCFAGREASRAMAKLSFEEAELSNGLNIRDLGPFETQTLDDWVQKFHMKGYPVVGRVSEPPTNRTFTREELAVYNGENESTRVEGRVDLRASAR